MEKLQESLDSLLQKFDSLKQDVDHLKRVEEERSQSQGRSHIRLDITSRSSTDHSGGKAHSCSRFARVHSWGRCYMSHSHSRSAKGHRQGRYDRFCSCSKSAIDCSRRRNDRSDSCSGADKTYSPSRHRNWAERMEEDLEETPDFNEDLTLPNDDEVNDTFEVCDKTEKFLEECCTQPYHTPEGHRSAENLVASQGHFQLELPR